MTHTTSLTARAALAAALLASAGCATNPFAPSKNDTRQVATPERLRSIGVFNLERAAVDENPLPPEEQIKQTLETHANTESVELTLAQARAAALANNLGLDATLIAPEIASQRVNEEWARFDASFTLSANWSETDTPVASTLVGSLARNQGITPGLSVPLLTGGTLEVRTPINRSSTNNAFAILNPAWTSDVEVSLSHNLLRGAGRRATTHGVRLAEYARQTSSAQTKLEVIRVLADVDRAYWRLYAAVRALEVVEQQYNVAIAQLERAQRLENAGTGTEVDVVRAQSGVATRVEAIISAQNTIKIQQRAFKQLVNMPGLGVDTETRILVASPPDPVRYEFDPSELTTQALSTRMEMLELEIQLARDAANIAFARNQKLPLLALSYTYRVNGLGGSLGNSVDTLAQNEFEDWAVALNAEFPIGNNAAKASLAQSILTRLQSLSTREARAQAITTEVHNAIDQIESTWQRILATREAVILNARLLDAEQRQFDVGRSTSTDVLDVDTNLADARLAEIRAIVDYQIAQIDLAVATGTLLGQARVELPHDARLDDSESRARANEGVVDYHPLSGTLVDP